VRYDAQEDQDVVATATGDVTVPAAGESLTTADRGGIVAPLPQGQWRQW
jgi:hypothetical protein